MPLFSGCVCHQKKKHQPKISVPVHLLLETSDGPRHVFKIKKVKKSRPCHVCHQPVLKLAQCCRVCKYMVHKGCEPKNNNEQGNVPKRPAISSRNTQSAARLSRVMNTPGSTPNTEKVSGQGSEGPRMDLVYVTERIISLAFPADLDDATYTLHLREVAHMLSSKHGDHFKIFNLSPAGEVNHFLPRVCDLGWPDLLAPALERLCSICKALDSWISTHSQNVAVLHSRHGYEKLGVVIAAYMHYSNICNSTDTALDRYAMKRYFDDKIKHFYHPSQKRYVHYFAGLLSGVIRINSNPLYLHTLTLFGVPHFEPQGGCLLFIKIYQGMTPIYTSGVYNLTEAMRQVTIVFEGGVQLRGDILLKVYHRRMEPPSREVIFRLQFHTCAVSDKILYFSRNDLDDACNDMRFPLDGGVELFFSHSTEDRPRSVSNVSCDKTPCPITAWDSYEHVCHSYQPTEDQGSAVNYTLGPLDGSLYATVSKQKRERAAALQRSYSPPTHSPPAPSPSPHGLPNGRYAASIDSGIASNNSAGHAPVSPPTSDSSSRASGDSRGTAPVAATAARPGAASAVTSSTGAARVDARQLDELLAGMLLDIESIPDVRPCQTPAPDIDSIRCPDFSSFPTKGRVSTLPRSGEVNPHPHHYHHHHHHYHSVPQQTYGCPPPPQSHHSPGIGYNGSTTQDSLMDTSLSTTLDEVPYHARTDSKPFSYGAVTSSPLLTRHRNSTDGIIDMPVQSTLPSMHRRSSREALENSRAGLESPHLVRKMSGGNIGCTSETERSPSPSPSPEPGSRGSTLRRERAQTLTTRIMNRDASPPLSRSQMTRSASRLDESSDASYYHDSLSRSLSTASNMGGSLTWLQMQQRKLADRKEAQIRAERAPQEAKMLLELRNKMSQQRVAPRDFEDGYVSDTTLFSETSRESSPMKTFPPLTINTGGPPSSPQKPPVAYSSNRGNSAPSSPILPNRHNQFSSTPRNISRKHSDMTHDRERPFVAVKRAHDTSRAMDNYESINALNQLQTSPLGHINYSNYSHMQSGHKDGLLTTVASANQSGDETAWQSDTDSTSIAANRPITPGFPPATPTTPYLNQGLPPKSPTMQRKETGGIRSPSPASASGVHRHEMNGHSSPAPSLYHGQSRRSSLTSLNETAEVISSHPKFVKDISKFWYKPNISRDEAINMLRDKLPGTFVVRDSNSFPGAFGLALKVSTLPPNVAAKSNDPSSELVRHFLIEPTSRGVRLKGCPNEPIFGSLSALVYQHSITALALPCRLNLPERDPGGVMDTVDSSQSMSPNNTATSQQLLQQGAACNVLYLYTADTESLTGPQAVKRAVQIMLAARPTSTVVHFKVSAQGITLTDNSRKLFFRRHYPVCNISHCGLDPDDRRWTQKNEEGAAIGTLRLFGFVAKKGSSKSENQCHILAELEPEQPATAIVNFVTKVMMTSINRSNLV